MTDGRASVTVARDVATLRSILAFAVADGRLTINAAAAVKAPLGGEVVQVVLEHFSAAMTLDVYGHLVAANLWESVARLWGAAGALDANASARRLSDKEGNGA